MHFDYISELWFDFKSLQLGLVKKRRWYHFVSPVFTCPGVCFLISAIFTLPLKDCCLFFCCSLLQHTPPPSFYNTVLTLLFYLHIVSRVLPFKTHSPLAFFSCSLQSVASKFFIPAVLKFWKYPY